MNAKKWALIALFCFFCAGNVFAQSADADKPDADKEAAVVEIGAAANWSVNNGGSSFGPNFAVEVTPIEHWLELEAGVTPLFTSHSTEWDVDLLFKKPWTISKKVEFMAGVGPEWIHTSDRGVKTNSVAGEAALDFMFWPFAKHRFGWYVEPAYDYSFGPGHEQSAGFSGGLLITIP